MNQGCHDHDQQRADCADCASDATITAINVLAAAAGLEGEKRMRLHRMYATNGAEGIRAFLNAAELRMDAAGLAALERATKWQASVGTEPAPALSSQHVRRIANSHGLSEREIAMCAELKLNPETYAADKAARKGA